MLINQLKLIYKNFIKLNKIIINNINYFILKNI